MTVRVENRAAAAALFGETESTMVVSCLSGMMGELYGDHPRKPKSAAVRLGDFCFLAGEPNPSLAAFAVQEGNYHILIPQNQVWAETIRNVYGERAVSFVRYAMKKRDRDFDVRKLKALASALPDGCHLELIEEVLYQRCLAENWSEDLVAQYPDFQTYRKMGLGVAAVKDGEIYSGASSYCSFPGGIEIEIDTRQDKRRRGLAAACGARLILECESRGLYPGWDAHSLASASLAEKLGYQISREYEAYEISTEEE